MNCNISKMKQTLSEGTAGKQEEEELNSYWGTPERQRGVLALGIKAKQGFHRYRRREGHFR